MLAASAACAAADSCQPPSRETATRSVVRVIDAETLALDDGTEVRLAGVLAPHPPAAAEASQWPLEDEARRAVETAAQGRSVSVVPLPSSSRDRYGRVVAHVYIAAEDGLTWLQGTILDAGLARVAVNPGAALCAGEMRAHEAAARSAKRGLWASAAYRIIDASDTRELFARTGDFVLVEGRVAAVAAKSRRLYLNFGSDWRRDFTIAIPPAIMTKRDAAAVDALRTSAGKTVRVRGWIERRNGPLIEIMSPADIELLEAQNEQRPAEGQPGAVESQSR